MALLLSSHVAASQVGGGAQSFVLNSAGIDTMLVPTVLYGRHPGWGEPGGETVEQAVMASQLDAIGQQGLFNLTDLVLTGYFADVGQIFQAAETIDLIRLAPREHDGRTAFSDEALIVVDPVMGDAPDGLYVPKPVAAAIRDQLVSRADLVTPNVFELGHLTGRALTDLASMVRAARSLERPVLVSSLPRHGRIGVLYADAEEAWLVTHERCARAPNGTGDVLTAAFVTAIVEGAEPKSALEYASAAVFSVVQRANEWHAPELPIVAARNLLKSPLVSLTAEPV